MIASRITILLLLYCLATLASTSTTSRSSYESIRALDESGQSIQLQHAGQAATSQGNLVMAIKHENNTIHILSVVHQHKHHHQRHRPLDLVHTITPNAFVACSGVQADTRWLVETLRLQQKQIQLRYGSSSGSSNWAQRLASVYRAVFWGLPEDDKNNKWQHARFLQLERRWGRPLGVHTIVLEGNQLSVVEPSGVILCDDDTNRVVAIGKYSSEILRQWSSAQTNDSDEFVSFVDQLKVVCRDILPRGTVLVVVQPGTNDSWQMQL